MNQRKTNKIKERPIDSRFKKYWKLVDKKLKEKKDKQWALGIKIIKRR
jgi:hypothetical protein